eukprot:5120943-Prymnesium_polylepis.1
MEAQASNRRRSPISTDRCIRSRRSPMLAAVHGAESGRQTNASAPTAIPPLRPPPLHADRPRTHRTRPPSPRVR